MKEGPAPNLRPQHSWLLIAAGVLGIVAMVAIGTAFARAINPAPLDVVVTAVDPATGEVLWTEDLQLRSPWPAHSAAGTIVVEGGGIALIDADGRTRWRLRDGHITQVRAEGSVAYARREFSTGEDMAAIEVSSGRILWTRSDARLSAATNGVAALYVDGGGKQVVDSRTGKEIISTRKRVVDIAAGGGVVALLSRQSLTIVRPGSSVVEVDMTHAGAARRILAVSEEHVVTEHRGERVAERGPRSRIVIASETAGGKVRWRRTLEPYNHTVANSKEIWFFGLRGTTSVDITSGAINSDADPPPDLTGLDSVDNVLVGLASLFEPTAGSIDYYTYGPDRSGMWGGGTTVAVAEDTGGILWSRAAASFVSATATTAVLSTPGGFVAVAADSGETLVAVDSRRRNSVVTIDEHVAFLAGGKLTTIAADGTVATLLTVKPTSRIVAASDDVVVIDDQRKLVDGRPRTMLTAYDLETGERLWKRKSEGYASAEIDADGLHLTRAGKVTTLDAGTGEQLAIRPVDTQPPRSVEQRSEVLLAIDPVAGEHRWTMRPALDIARSSAGWNGYAMAEGVDRHFGVVEDVVVVVDVLGPEG